MFIIRRSIRSINSLHQHHHHYSTSEHQPIRGIDRYNLDYLSIRPDSLYRTRLSEYYDNHLSSDLLYMTYQLPAGYSNDGTTPHNSNGRALVQHPDPTTRLPNWDPEDPYASNRPPRPPRGGSASIPRKPKSDSSPSNLVRLSRITIDTHVSEAIHTKKELLGAIYLLKLISGQLDRSSLSQDQLTRLSPDQGIRLSRTKDRSTTFKVRRNMVCGVNVTIQGPRMFDFIDTLTTFVLPRLKDFNGFSLPPSDSHHRHNSMVSGVVQIGLSDHGMGLWPGVEESLENWPRKYGMNIHFITNATGPGATEKARALMSGFRIPFVRPEDAKLKR
ncbi:ribosomal protein L5 domain-containing protein [Phakopsora pachyrhizi]|uniref:Ribosomal protein L5 domain-containing protein n=1 Tax=Phakopsora pachyrhizi TaxID=170000 RepID=A0AAV0AG73_PHAPC|nr:ribosomal protein L5 domain-containing protein [Phakopsora pachyrhizi]CAH7666710.1 ribosomal protein L5 domain-containing protein [Phakopsora pachyrhizi]